jgi:hypothetical protein
MEMLESGKVRRAGSCAGGNSQPLQKFGFQFFPVAVPNRISLLAHKKLTQIHEYKKPCTLHNGHFPNSYHS